MTLPVTSSSLSNQAAGTLERMLLYSKALLYLFILAGMVSFVRMAVNEKR